MENGAIALLRRRFVAADVETAVDLARIRDDDFCAHDFRNPARDLGLPGAGRAENERQDWRRVQ
jgi:hypothetical protein